MGILLKGKTFGATEQVTSAKLHELVDNADFTSSAVDNASVGLTGAGALTVKTGGITPAKLSSGAPTWTNYGQLSARLLESTNVNGSTGGVLTLAVPAEFAADLNNDVDNVKMDIKGDYLRFWSDDTGGDQNYMGAEINLSEMKPLSSGRMNRIVSASVNTATEDKVHVMQTITQAAYDLLSGSEDPNTLYIIV